VVSLTGQALDDPERNPGTREIPDESFSPQRQMKNTELSEHIQRAIDSLPNVLRLTFVLREFEDLSYGELALALDCSQGTVKSRLSRAREALRRKLEPYLAGDS